MSGHTAAVLIIALSTILRGVIVSWTSYGVFVMGASAWWFVPTAFAFIVAGANYEFSTTTQPLPKDEETKP